MKTEIPHALPYALYVAVGAAGTYLGEWTDAVRFAVVGAAVVWFLARGAYPELRARPTVLHAAAAVGIGLGIAAFWVPLSELVPLLPLGKRDAMDPGAVPAHAIVLRIATMVILAPLVEEPLIRSAIPRLVDAPPGADWRTLPLGVWSKLAFLVSVGFFTLTHPEWLAALVTGVLWMVLLAWTKNLMTTVISHAVANAGLAVYVMHTGDTRWW